MAKAHPHATLAYPIWGHDASTEARRALMDYAIAGVDMPMLILRTEQHVCERDGLNGIIGRIDLEEIASELA